MMNIIPKLEKISTERGNMALLARYLLDYQGNLSELKVKEICDDLYISVASATRLAKHLGLNGFSELKTYLAIEQSQNETDENEFQNNITKDYYKTITNTLDNTLKIIDIALINQIAKDILEYKQVNLFGGGEDILILQEFGYKLMCLGIKTSFYQQQHLQKVEAMTSDNQTLAIGLDFCGDQISILDHMNECKKQGAKTIVLTSNELFDTTNVDNIILISGGHVNFNYTSISRRICSQAVFDLILLKITELNTN